MTDELPLAAEQALRLLDGEEQMAAHRLMASDPAFAADVTWWEDRFGPLFDDITAEPISADLWPNIVARLDAPAPELTLLKRKLFRWRAATGAAAAAAAVLLALQLRPDAPSPAPVPEQVQTAPLLVAGLSGAEAPEVLTVAYRPDSRMLVITPQRIEAAASRARQLWLIPEGGQPISLGLVAPEGVQRRTISAEVAAQFVAGATVAVSDEPAGGSPTGQPTGTVLATGGLGTV